jgi:PKD repeat protein
LNNFEYLLTEPGQYTLTYEHQAGEFLSSYSVIVEVLPAPSAPIVINQNPNLNCLNCGSEGITWFWNDAILEGESSSLLNYLDGNVYQNGEYYAQIQNEDGCISRGNDVMVFVANMTSDVNIGCAPLGVNFENITMEISQLVCDINYGDFTGESNFEGSIQHVYTLPGEYTATLNCTDGNLESSMELEIVVGAPIDIDVYWNNVSEQVVCSNPSAFDSITWYIGVDELTGPGPFADEVGTWTVVGVTPEGCISSDEVVVTNISELENGGIRVYPNPAHGHVVIDLQSMVADDLALYNALGERVWSYSMASTGRLQADWSHLAPGVYHLSFMSNGSLKSGQMIITQ